MKPAVLGVRGSEEGGGERESEALAKTGTFIFFFLKYLFFFFFLLSPCKAAPSSAASFLRSGACGEPGQGVPPRSPPKSGWRVRGELGRAGGSFPAGRSLF